MDELRITRRLNLNGVSEEWDNDCYIDFYALGIDEVQAMYGDDDEVDQNDAKAVKKRVQARAKQNVELIYGFFAGGMIIHNKQLVKLEKENHKKLIKTIVYQQFNAILNLINAESTKSANFIEKSQESLPTANQPPD